MHGAIYVASNRKRRNLGNSPAWSRWAETRQDWIMGTQKREVRSTLAMKIIRLGARFLAAPLTLALRAAGCRESRLRSQLVQPKNRAGGLGNESPSFPAREATETLRSKKPNQQHVCVLLGSPPTGAVAVWGSLRQRSLGFPPIQTPAECSRFHPTLPWVPTGLRQRTERYDGKRDLYFQHAA